MKDTDNSLGIFVGEILVSVISVFIFKARKKYFTKPNLFDIYHWALVILIPTPAAIPVLFSISPKSDIILIPYWIAVWIWIAVTYSTELNREERPYINKLVIKMGAIFFSIGIFAHWLLHYLVSLGAK